MIVHMYATHNLSYACAEVLFSASNVESLASIVGVERVSATGRFHISTYDVSAVYKSPAQIVPSIFFLPFTSPKGSLRDVPKRH